MKIIIRTFVLAASFALAVPCLADVKEIQETLNVVWEGLWFQQGYPQRVYKWQEPIRVRFSGASLGGYRVFALEQLKRVTSVAGIEVEEVSDPRAAVNVEVEFVRDNPISRTDPCVTHTRHANGIIQHAQIKVPERSVRHCILHEFMHAMGVSGHPSANSILSYFRTSQELTKIDAFILQVLYSEDIKPSMYPLPALKVYAQRLVQAALPGEAKREAEQVTTAFLRDAIRQMEAFALPKGEPPLVVLRSGKATAAGLARGRIDVQFLLGLAYTYGQGVEVDKKKAFDFLAAAAAQSHRDAQLYLGDAYRLGRGIERDPIEAYKWYLVAGARGVVRAKAEAEKLETSLPPSELEQGKARAAAWKPATVETPTAQADR